MASIIIGIMGKKRSGKDTFAARLVSEHGYTRLAFADALKESLLELDPLVTVEGDELAAVYGPGMASHLNRLPHFHRLSSLVEELGWDGAKSLREVRALLQRHGVAMRNHVHPEVWVDAVVRKANDISGPVVITDVRFPNEADRVEYASGGRLVRISRPGLKSDDTHVSETALDARAGYAYVVNDGTVADLHKAADVIAEDMTHCC